MNVPSAVSYMNVPPAAMHPPGDDKLKAFAEKLETAEFRSALVSPPSFYAGALTSHISQFWRARMIGGYGTGVPKRLADLPWPEGVRSLRMIELRSMSGINPALLSLLNVKYLITPTADLYFDTPSASSDKSPEARAPGGSAHAAGVMDVDGISLGVTKNSIAPLPRHFLAERVTGVRETPRMQGAALEARASPERKGEDGTGTPDVVSEGIGQLTSHSLVEDFRGSQVFDASGPLDVTTVAMSSTFG
jgi:hypothetical protein